MFGVEATLDGLPTLNALIKLFDLGLVESTSALLDVTVLFGTLTATDEVILSIALDRLTEMLMCDDDEAK